MIIASLATCFEKSIISWLLGCLVLCAYINSHLYNMSIQVSTIPTCNGNCSSEFGQKLCLVD